MPKNGVCDLVKRLLPSCDQKPGRSGRHKGKAKPRPSRPGSARSLADAPDETIKRLATACPHCAADVSGQMQSCRHRYDYIDLPPIAPVVTRIELFGGRCSCCGRRFRATAPAGMAPGSPFGASIRSLLLYLHHSHHVGFERLSRMMAEFTLAVALDRAHGARQAGIGKTRRGIIKSTVIIKWAGSSAGA